MRWTSSDESRAMNHERAHRLQITFHAELLLDALSAAPGERVVSVVLVSCLLGNWYQTRQVSCLFRKNTMVLPPAQSGPLPRRNNLAGTRRGPCREDRNLAVCICRRRL